MKLLSLLLLFFSILGLGLRINSADDLPQRSVASVLVELGDTSNHNTVDPRIKKVDPTYGRDIVLQGYTSNDKGRKTRKQSKYFTCVACHNTVREDPDLTQADPEARLAFLAEKQLPFLPASTFYGIVDRETFYNDDYVKKYGDLTLAARNDIRYSIQLCATECAQGRALEDWEVESVLAYFWELGLSMDDLDLDETEMEEVAEALSRRKGKDDAIALIKSKYLQKSPAHFEKPIVKKEDRLNYDGDIDNGQLIYETSCQHCHFDNQYSFRILDNSPSTFKKLVNDFPEYHKYSVYEVVRWGTSPLTGKKAYMPFYPLEKMSNKQVKDLTSYIAQEAEG